MSRYARQELIEGWDQASLAAAHVLVVGAGTTGNEVIKNLALLGVGELTIIDSDHVEEVNLSRSVLFRPQDMDRPKAIAAAGMATELNPALVAHGLVVDVVSGFGNQEYARFACVILTVDNLEARMWVNRYCWMTGTPLINTGVGGLKGNVSVLHPPHSACLECSWSDIQYATIDEKYSCLKIGLDAFEPKIPMVITSAAVVGGIAAQEAVRIISESPQPTASRISYDGDSRAWMTIELRPSSRCRGHLNLPQSPDPATWHLAARDDSIDEARQRLRSALDADDVMFSADKPIVYRAACRDCGAITPVPPGWLATFRRARCPQCGGYGAPYEEQHIVAGPYTFGELGIPPNHLLAVTYERRGEVRDTWMLVR